MRRNERVEGKRGNSVEKCEGGREGKYVTLDIRQTYVRGMTAIMKGGERITRKVCSAGEKSAALLGARRGSVTKRKII